MNDRDRFMLMLCSRHPPFATHSHCGTSWTPPFSFFMDFGGCSGHLWASCLGSCWLLRSAAAAAVLTRRSWFLNRACARRHPLALNNAYFRACDALELLLVVGRRGVAAFARRLPAGARVWWFLFVCRTFHGGKTQLGYIGCGAGYLAQSCSGDYATAEPGQVSQLGDSRPRWQSYISTT